MRQGDGEPVRKFYARIRQCRLTVQCPEASCRYHNAPFVSYGDEVVKQVVLCGLADDEIKKETMAWNFSITWVPGTAIPGPDATSRQSQASTGEEDDFTVAVAALQIEEDEIRDLTGDMEFAAYGRGDQGGYMGAGTG